MITIINYGMGNIRSVAKALEFSGRQIKVSDRPQDVLEAESVVLPGVGAFSAGMRNLHRLGLIPPILQTLKKNKPFLGICLGMQLMFEKSCEGSECRGIGVLEGSVKKFGGGLRVPHVGWNTVKAGKKSALFKGINECEYFYFVHSYYTEPVEKEIILATTDYGIKFASAVQKENIYLTQFHPEKSHENGLELLINFCRL